MASLAFIACFHIGISANTLRVGGLFSQFQLDDNFGYVVDNAGVRETAAVQMAITQVNNKSDGVYDNLLPNTTLELLVRDSKREETQAQGHVYTLAASDCVAYIGPSASGPAKVVSVMTSMPPRDRAVISYSATSTELSEPRFANFLRTPPADDVLAEVIASFMVDDFLNWTCANVIVGMGDSYSSAGAAGFKDAANKHGINVCMTSSYVPDSTDMKTTMQRIMDARCCLLTVVFAQPKDTVALLLAAHEVHYSGEWLMGETVIDSHIYLTDQLKKSLGDTAEVNQLMKGIFSFRPKLVTTNTSVNFERAWYNQASTANMLSDGTRTDCSDSRDATGNYIWRENGAKNGQCCGIDFEQAKRKRDAGVCNDDDFVCEVTKLSGYEPFAYDAAIALALGLDKLVKKGISPNEMKAGPLFEAIRKSTFDGASGRVSFKENGDRRVDDDVEYNVYNYQVHDNGGHGFANVGYVRNTSFVRCTESKCRPMMFSDGSQHPPNIKRTVFYVGGLFRQFLDNEISKSGIRRMSAVQLAISNLNNKADGIFDSILPNTQLKLLVRDSKKDSSQTLAQVYDLVPVHNCIAIIGPASSSPTKEVSRWLLKMPEQEKRVVIGYSATSTELSGAEFTNFIRTPPADDAVATQMASFMAEIGWTCANILIGADDSFSTAGGEAFEKAAKIEEIQVQTNFFQNNQISKNIEQVIQNIIAKRFCKATVVFGAYEDYSELLLAAYKQKYRGEWIMGSNFGNDVSKIRKELVKQSARSSDIDEMLNGVLYLEQPRNTKPEFAQAWYNQSSTSKMLSNGTRTDCSDAKDATGRYVWREDGEKDGRCFGLDFQEARQQNCRTDKSKTNDEVCVSTRISQYVPYAYDAAIALAHGLDKLVKEGVSPDKMTAGRLSEAIRNSPFEGASGKVLFEENGDRNSTNLKYTVYDYNSADGKFVDAGRVHENGTFTENTKHAIIFANGSSVVPTVKIPEAVETTKDPKNTMKLDPQNDSNLGSLAIALIVVSLIFGLVVVPGFYCMSTWRKEKLREQKKRKANAFLKARLLKNWSALLSADYVDELSQMPEEWKSGIVPVRSENGQALNNRMQRIGKQIESTSTSRWQCGSGMKERKLRALETSMNDFIQKNVAAFFKARDNMYNSYLLKNPKAKVQNTIPLANTEAAGPTPKCVPVESKLTESQHAVVDKPSFVESTQHGESWPKNTTPLFRQIMFLLRDLDDMFKASYNQRFDLRILDDEIKEWSDWTRNEFPGLIPDDIVLKQNVSDLCHLYRQAAQVHAYYNEVFASVAKATKAKWIPAPLKKIFRILEKAEHVLQGDHVKFDCSKIFDVVRGTLVYDTLGDNEGGLLRGVRAVFALNNFEVIRLKDRFTHPTTACWRDVLLNGRMISRDGTVHPHLVEVQFHHKDLREERMNVGGHFIYERHRALFEACETACGSEAGAKLNELHSGSTDVDLKPRLRALMRRKKAISTFAALTLTLTNARRQSKNWRVRAEQNVKEQSLFQLQ